jgi:2'-5' RNA ligase
VPLIAVVAYPTLHRDDRGWLESIRAEHDPQAARLPGHFTLVFPADVALDGIAAEVAAAARSVEPIQFVIRSAKAVRDVSSRGGHVFLVPSEGAEPIARLHDRLYEGLLKPHLRGDLPFEPHITVAANADFYRCEAIADALNREHRVVAGTLEAVELLDVTQPGIISAGQFALAKPPSL